MLFPVIALILSTLFEGITWSLAQLGGVVLVLMGNVIVLTKIRFGRRFAASTSESGAE